MLLSDVLEADQLWACDADDPSTVVALCSLGDISSLGMICSFNCAAKENRQ